MSTTSRTMIWAMVVRLPWTPGLEPRLRHRLRRRRLLRAGLNTLARWMRVMGRLCSQEHRKRRPSLSATTRLWQARRPWSWTRHRLRRFLCAQSQALLLAVTAWRVLWLSHQRPMVLPVQAWPVQRSSARGRRQGQAPPPCRVRGLRTTLCPSESESIHHSLHELDARVTHQA